MNVGNTEEKLPERFGLGRTWRYEIIEEDDKNNFNPNTKTKTKTIK